MWGFPCPASFLIPTMFSLKDAVAALTAYKEARNDNVVSAEEIQRRAAICSTCPVRETIRIHPQDQAARMLALRAAKNRVPAILSERKCGVCKCPLLLLTVTLPSLLHRDSPEEAVKRATEAPNCWLPGAIAGGDP